jgi:hypothetical protein
MKKHSGIASAVCIGLLSIIFTSCPEVMGTSWGVWAKRSPKIPAITSDNLDSLLDATVGDPDFAEALLEELKKKAGSKDGEELAAFQGAAITAAANGSGLDILVVTHLGGLINGDGPDGDNTDKITETFDIIFNDADHGTIHTLAEDLTEILLINENVYDSAEYWEDPPVSSDSLLVAVTMLLVAEADNQNADNFSDYLETFKAKREEGVPLTPNERAIRILVKQLDKRDSDTFGPLLEGLKLDDL